MSAIFPDAEIGYPLSNCYYCGNRIKGPCVWWRGAPDIWLHPECVVQMMIRMMSDVHEIQCKTVTRFEPVLGFDKD